MSIKSNVDYIFISYFDINVNRILLKNVNKYRDTWRFLKITCRFVSDFFIFYFTLLFSFFDIIVFNKMVYSVLTQL
jgi:hypothetical protein